jgi:hypothetical protein
VSRKHSHPRTPEQVAKIRQASLVREARRRAEQETRNSPGFAQAGIANAPSSTADPLAAVFASTLNSPTTAALASKPQPIPTASVNFRADSCPRS